MAEDQQQQFKPGSMDIRAQEHMFSAFVRFAIWVVGLSFLFLVLLAMFNA